MTSNTSGSLSSCASNAGDHLPAYVAGFTWQPTRTGDYATDCQAGRMVADDILQRVTRENPLLLSVVARSIVESGRWDAVEIGLFSRLGMALV